MDIQRFGRELADVLAQRSLDVIRNTKMNDVRDIWNGQFPGERASAAASAGMTIGAVLVGAAIGAGVTALLTPTSGPELRKRVSKSARGARKQAMALGESVVSQAEEALHDVYTNATTAIGLTSPAPAHKRRTSNGHAHASHNGHARRSTRHAHA